MSQTTSLVKSSIGQKMLMALTGLFLCSFLLEHLAGNLLLFVDDGGSMYDTYAEVMSGNFIIRTIEIGLFLGFAAHIIYGTKLWIMNKRKRPVPYEKSNPSANSTLASRIAFVTGSIVFIFLVVHLKTFFAPMRFDATHPSGYRLVMDAFQSPLYVAFYLVALFLLGYHLRHGFQSAFQTLGWLQSRYNKLIRFFGFVFWFIIPFGYAIIPVYFLWFHMTGGY